MEKTSVLMVGGGLVGLSAAVFLATRGVPAVLVERHPASSPLPRAMGFTTRTMELYRAAGLGDAIPQVPPGLGRPRRIKVESLAGKWSSDDVAWTPGEAPDQQVKDDTHFSICTGAAIAQDRLEPILRAHAIKLGVDVRLSTELVAFEQDHRGVTAMLRDSQRREGSLRADYLIAADGHASPVREALGIGRSGRGMMRTVRSILFRAAALDGYLKPGISQFEIDQPGFEAMLTVYRDASPGQQRWLLIVADDGDHDEAGLRAMVQRAVGRPEMDFEIIATGLWQLSALIADRFAAGRIFLAGDAAHTLPPARGGYGANTGIEDAHNLAWKLAAVLAGRSRPELLDSYDAERRPIAWLRHDQIFARPDYARYARPGDKDVPIIDDVAMELGQIYRSAAVIDAGPDLPPALRPDLWTGQPGTRAPHVWVGRDGVRCSTLDLLQRDWVLLTKNARWREPAAAVGARLALKLDCVLIDGGGKATLPPPVTSPLDVPIERIAGHPAGKAVLDIRLPQVMTHSGYDTFKSLSLRQLLPLSQGQLSEDALAWVARDLAGTDFALTPAGPVDAQAFGHAFGIGSSGASLVRPDGYIAWRVKEFPAEPEEALAQALHTVAFCSAEIQAVR